MPAQELKWRYKITGYGAQPWVNSAAEVDQLGSALLVQYGWCSATPTSHTAPSIAYNGSMRIAEDYGSNFDVVTSTSTATPCDIHNTVQLGILKRRVGKCDQGFGLVTNASQGPICVCQWGSSSVCPIQVCYKGSLNKANPCDVTTGYKNEIESDYSGTGANPLRFVRTYSSKLAVQYFKGFTNGNGDRWEPLGIGWTANYLQRISYTSIANNSGLQAIRPDGSEIPFTEDASGSFSYYGSLGDRVERVFSGPTHTGWKYTTASDEVELYDLEGRLLSITYRSGVVHALAYSSLGYLASVTDSFGNALTFSWNSDRQIASVTAPGSLLIQYSYNASTGNLASVTYPDTKSRIYHYELTGEQVNLLTGITDEASVRFATWGYDAQSRVISSEHNGGVERFSFEYPYAGTTRKVTDPLGTLFTYNVTSVYGHPRVTGANATCAGCGTLKAASYDTHGNAISRTEFNNVETTFAYDTTRTLETSRTEAFGTAKARTIATTWHSTFRLPTLITEPNRTTSFTHDANGNVLTRTVTDTSVTPNVVRTWTYSYNALGKVLSEDGPRTDVSDLTSYTYFSCATGYQCGQLSTITNAAGHVTTYNAYNVHGQATQITDPNGLVSTMAYDSRQRLTDRCIGSYLPACSGGELTHLDYWSTGLLKKATNPDGSYVEYTYDGAHRLTQINDGAGNKIVYTLDNAGNRTAENTYDPSLSLKRTHSRVFNTLNQLWKDVNAAGTANVTTIFGYDTNGNQTTTNAPLSRNSTNLYDELNRLKQVTDPNSGITQFGYDANDNLTSVTDPRNLVTSYTYTGFGELKTQTSPDTGLTTNTYDSGGNLATSTDARNAITTYTYDSMNRVLNAAYKIGTTTDQTNTFTYDAGTNGKGHLTGASNASHTMSWSYDAQGRVTGKGQTVGTVTKSIGYGYNAQGQLASTVLPSGKTLQYGYDSNGQVTSVTLLGSPNVTILSNVTYDPFGPVTGWTWGNGQSSSRTFDTDGKLTSTSHPSTLVGNRTFGYDDAFRITSTTDSFAGGPNWTLGYDVLDRLSSATGPSTIGYTYDADGNRLTQTGTSPSTYTVSGTSNRLLSTTGALVRSYTYDATGSVLTSGATTHTYYNNGRMKTARLGAASNTTYVYNALGQRVKNPAAALPTRCSCMTRRGTWSASTTLPALWFRKLYG